MGVPGMKSRLSSIAAAAEPEYSTGLRKADQVHPDRIRDELRRLVNAEFAHDVGAVHTHRIGAEIELSGNFLVRLAFDDQTQNFELPPSELAAAF